MLITAEKDYEKCLAEVERFVPYIDNWATCDLPAPKCFAKHKQELFLRIKEWIASEETYTIRYGIDLLMALYLDADFRPEYLELAASVASEEYYVKMVIAWYFATALAKQWDAAISLYGASAGSLTGYTARRSGRRLKVTGLRRSKRII